MSWTKPGPDSQGIKDTIPMPLEELLFENRQSGKENWAGAQAIRLCSLLCTNCHMILHKLFYSLDTIFSSAKWKWD